MNNIIAYVILLLAVVLGTTANGFAKSANGFTLFLPSLLTAITIVGCMFTLSIVMLGNKRYQFLVLCIGTLDVGGGAGSQRRADQGYMSPRLLCVTAHAGIASHVRPYASKLPDQ